MTVNRRIGLGFTLGVDPTGSTSYTTLGAIVSGFKGPNAKADVADISILADTYKQFAKSQIDPGEYTFTIAYDPDDTTTSTLITCFKSVTPPAPAWVITYPAGSTGAGTIVSEPFAAHLVGLGREVEKDKLVTCEITLKVTGTPGLHGA